MRKIVLDTETTGLNRSHNGSVCKGHRIIEIGCIEILDGIITGEKFHAFVKPDCSISPKALEIHGITDQFLESKPKFEDVVESFLKFIGTSYLVIHNAPFDVAFLDQEFTLLHEKQQPKLVFTVIDTLKIARKCFPGGDNTLDALAKRYGIGLERRNKHGALLDAEMLARVYLMMELNENSIPSL